jgi:DMSO reductase family type II enzyme heme b subunit
VNAWYWRADAPTTARQVSAEGLGTTHAVDKTVVHGRGGWKEGSWQVVLARALESESPAARVELGGETGVGIAIWQGNNSERAGLKAFSGTWIPLQLAPANTGGKS